MPNSHYSVVTENAEKVLRARYYEKDQNGNPIEDFDGMCKRVAKCAASAYTKGGAVLLNDDRIVSQSFQNQDKVYFNLINSLDFLPNTPTLVNAGRKSGLSACYVLPIENNILQIFETLKNTALIHKSGGGTGFNFTSVKMKPAANKEAMLNVFLATDHPDYKEYMSTEFKNIIKATSDNISNLRNDFKNIIEIEDNMESIFDFNNIFMVESIYRPTNNDTVISFNKLRATNSIVNSTKGVASGPVSFMKAWDAVMTFIKNDITPITTIKVFDACTEVVKQGGVRRGANMGIVNMDSEYILSFINCKENNDEINNFNLSVGVTDSKLFDDDSIIQLKDYSFENGKDCDSIKAHDLLYKIAQSAWRNGEPGLIFLDKINRDNSIKDQNIVATNPCGEQPLFPYEACNLGSINLVNMMKRVSNDDDESYKFNIDHEKLKNTVCGAVDFLDDIITVNHYPIPEVGEMVRRYRKIGLGVMGFADILYMMEIEYGSPESIAVARYIALLINGHAHAQSSFLGMIRGAYPASKKENTTNPSERNATVTTIAPTGSLSIIASVSSGIEPNFGIVYVRNTLGGDTQLYYVNRLFKEAFIKETGILEDSDEYNDIMKEIMDKGTVRGVNRVPKKLQKIFVCAHDITPDAHIEIQSAWQSGVDNAVSKTINMNSDATVDDVLKAYKKSYKLDCKGITIYRDGSRDSQVLVTGNSFKKEESIDKNNKERDTQMINYNNPTKKIDEISITIENNPRPQTVQGFTEKVKIGCGTLYVTVNYDSNNKIVEVFTNTGKSGGCPSQSEASARMASIALRYGVPLDIVIKQLKGIRCMSTIRKPGVGCLSCPDAIARVLVKTQDYLSKRGSPNTKSTESIPSDSLNNVMKRLIEDSEEIKTIEKDINSQTNDCPECGNKLSYGSGCCLCMECGYSKCN
ncbi:MAG: adenosylcobalamin-dependent ribonucleoside-diphosphate reductase [Herbinix sp.]|nr:adenosylcobalamin-dependent ribonucleoside-diphosphate reductase [Herbinix sp.]